MLKYLERSAHQSGFLANDSCVDQLLSFVHNIDTAFDTHPTLEYCEVFLDMSKAVGKVWHEGLIFKLKSVGTSNVLLDFIESLSENRFQRVVMMNAVAKIWTCAEREFRLCWMKLYSSDNHSLMMPQIVLNGQTSEWLPVKAGVP